MLALVIQWKDNFLGEVGVAKMWRNFEIVAYAELVRAHQDEEIAWSLIKSECILIKKASGFEEIVREGHEKFAQLVDVRGNDARVGNHLVVYELIPGSIANVVQNHSPSLATILRDPELALV